MQNFKTLRQSLLGELAMSPEERKKERKKEKKRPFIVATYVYASSQGQRTHSAWTKSIVLVSIELFCIVFYLFVLYWFGHFVNESNDLP